MPRQKDLKNLWVNKEDEGNAEEVAKLLETIGFKVRTKDGKINHSRIYRYLVLNKLGQLRLEEKGN